MISEVKVDDGNTASKVPEAESSIKKVRERKAKKNNQHD